MFIGWAILAGHDMIPHHHHDDAHVADIHHHHSGSHHHHGGEPGDPGDPSLDLLVHPDGGFVFIAGKNLRGLLTRPVLDWVTVLPCPTAIVVNPIPLLLYEHPPDPSVYVPPHLLFPGLRAPPVSIS
jgi:hypothetical protein